MTKSASLNKPPLKIIGYGPSTYNTIAPTQNGGYTTGTTWCQDRNPNQNEIDYIIQCLSECKLGTANIADKIVRNYYGTVIVWTNCRLGRQRLVYLAEGANPISRIQLTTKQSTYGSAKQNLQRLDTFPPEQHEHLHFLQTCSPKMLKKIGVPQTQNAERKSCRAEACLCLSRLMRFPCFPQQNERHACPSRKCVTDNAKH